MEGHEPLAERAGRAAGASRRDRLYIERSPTAVSAAIRPGLAAERSSSTQGCARMREPTPCAAARVHWVAIVVAQLPSAARVSGWVSSMPRLPPSIPRTRLPTPAARATERRLAKIRERRNSSGSPPWPSPALRNALQAGKAEAVPTDRPGRAQRPPVAGIRCRPKGDSVPPVQRPGEPRIEIIDAEVLVQPEAVPHAPRPSRVRRILQAAPAPGGHPSCAD